MLTLLLTTLLLQPAPSAPSASPARDVPAHITITVNAEEAPDLKDWGDASKSLCEEWYPKIAEALKSDGFTPRDTGSIVFRKKMRVPAATGGGTISVNAEYLKNHLDDRGMMIHELVHVVQAYPRNAPNMGWLTEGIADYIRFWIYEPQVRQRPINRQKASYKDAYRTSAAFLAWLTDTYDKEIVNKLNARLRKGGADDTIFKDLLGKTVDELWKEFIEAGAPSSPALPDTVKDAPALPSTTAPKQDAPAPADPKK